MGNTAWADEPSAPVSSTQSVIVPDAISDTALASESVESNVLTGTAALKGSSFTSDGVTYVITNATGTDGATPSVTVGDGRTCAVDANDARALTIPSTVTCEGTTYTVTRISAYAFYGSKLCSAHIPATVTSIGDRAFENAHALTTCTFDDNAKLTSIGSYCFADESEKKSDGSSGIVPSHLQTIDLPSGVQAIPSHCFYNQTSLTHASLGSWLSKGLKEYAFAGCTAMTSIVIPPIADNTDTYQDEYSVEGEWSDYLFYGCSNLKTIECLGTMYYYTWGYVDHVLEGCSSLKNIVFHSTPFRQLEFAYEDPDDYKTLMGLPISSLNFYDNVSFYASKEDAQTDQATFSKTGAHDASITLKGSAEILWKTSYGDIASGNVANSIYSGSVPACGTNCAWVFKDTPLSTATLSTSTYAYAVDAHDLSNARLSIADSYTQAALSNGCITNAVLTLADGTVLTEGTDYTLSYVNVTTGETVSAITKAGTYRVEAHPSSSRYTGTISAMTVYGTSGAFSRMGASDRYGTDQLIVEKTESELQSASKKKSDYLIVVTGANWPDGLTASALAGVKGASICLVAGDRQGNPETGKWLSSEDRARIAETGAKHIIIVGGDNVVPAAMEAEIKSIDGVRSIDRFSGDTRAQTAYDIYRKIAGSTISGDAWGDTAIVVTGTTPADALSVSALAYGKKAPIFLTTDGCLDSNSMKALSGFSNVLIIGGSNAISSDEESRIRSSCSSSTVTRLAGIDRYETNRKILVYELQHGFSLSSVVVASGDEEHWPDALAGSPLCGSMNAPLMLVDGTDESASMLVATLAPYRDSITGGYILGGTAAISDSSQLILNDLWK